MGPARILIGREVRIRVEIARWLMTRETAAQGGVKKRPSRANQNIMPYLKSYQPTKKKSCRAKK